MKIQGKQLYVFMQCTCIDINMAELRESGESMQFLIIPLAEFDFTNCRFLKLTCDCTLVNLVIYCINTSFLPLPHVQSKAEQGKGK